MFDEKALLNKDLNLLLVLVTLYEERSTARAAERLFVTQSSVSKGLKKLREQLNDPLFVRTRGGFIPTEKCDAFVVRINRLLIEMTEIYTNDVNQSSRLGYSGEIGLAINSMMSFSFANEIYNRLANDFPNATIRIVNWSESTEQQLLNSKIHVGINYFPIEVSKDLVGRSVLPDKFYLLVRKEHPLKKQSVSLQDIAQYPLVVSMIPNYSDRKSKIEHVLSKMKLQSKIMLRSDNVDLCLDVLNRSDCIMPINSLLRNKVAKDYSILNTDFDMDDYGSFGQIGVFYSQQLNQTQLGAMILESINKVFAQLSSTQS